MRFGYYTAEEQLLTSWLTLGMQQQSLTEFLLTADLKDICLHLGAPMPVSLLFPCTMEETEDSGKAI